MDRQGHNGAMDARPFGDLHRRFYTGAASILILLIVVSSVAVFTGGWDAANAIGTLLQAVGTIAAFTTALLLYAREKARDHALELDRRRSQAEKIGAWYGSEERLTGNIYPSTAIPPNSKLIWRLWVRNASDLPVFSVKPTVHQSRYAANQDVDRGGISHQLDLYWRMEDLKTGSARQVTRIAALPPGQTCALVVDTREEGTVNRVVDLEFRDNAGRWWRSTNGLLEQISPPQD